MFQAEYRKSPFVSSGRKLMADESPVELHTREKVRQRLSNTFERLEIEDWSSRNSFIISTLSFPRGNFNGQAQSNVVAWNFNAKRNTKRLLILPKLDSTWLKLRRRYINLHKLSRMKKIKERRRLPGCAIEIVRNERATVSGDYRGYQRQITDQDYRLITRRNQNTMRDRGGRSMPPLSRCNRERERGRIEWDGLYLAFSAISIHFVHNIK